jgi:transcriptional antiterminator RfaH
MNWYVIYTKPKWEKKIATQLNDIGITAYCPLFTKISQWSDRKKKIETPLFNSYLFVQIEEKNRNQIFVVSGVVRYLFWLGKPAIVKNSEIESIKNWLEVPEQYDVVVEKWKTGDKVVLESGPFASQTAVIQEVKTKQYVLILESLGCVLTVNKKEL